MLRCRTSRPGSKASGRISTSGPGWRPGPARPRESGTEPSGAEQAAHGDRLAVGLGLALDADRRPRHPGPAGGRRLDRLVERRHLDGAGLAERQRLVVERLLVGLERGRSPRRPRSASGDRRLGAVDPADHAPTLPAARSRGPTSTRTGIALAARRRRPGGRTGCRPGRRARPGHRRSRSSSRSSAAASATPSPSLTTMTCTWIGASRGGTRRPLSSPCAMIRPPSIRVEVPQEVVQACSPAAGRRRSR